MLADLVGWYAGREENRRRFPRVRKDYEAEHSRGGAQWNRVQGIDLGGGGMSVLSETAIPNIPLRIRMNLDGREVNLRALPIWNSPMNHKGKAMECCGLQFVSISAEDWGTVIRWITGDDPAKQEELAAVRMNATEVVTLLPFELRKRLLGELTTLSRFDPKAPLPVNFDYGGITLYEEVAMHKFTLYSKVKNAQTETLFSTRILCDDAGERIVVLGSET